MDGWTDGWRPMEAQQDWQQPAAAQQGWQQAQPMAAEPTQMEDGWGPMEAEPMAAEPTQAVPTQACVHFLKGKCLFGDLCAIVVRLIGVRGDR